MADLDVQLVQQGQTTTSQASIRSHRVLIDRPAAKSGADRGPMGGELLLASLGGCFLSNLIAAARAREVQIDDLRARVVGTLGEHPPRFEAVRLEVGGQNVAADTLTKLVAIAERGCIVANTLRGGVRLTVEILPT